LKFVHFQSFGYLNTLGQGQRHPACAQARLEIAAPALQNLINKQLRDHAIPCHLQTDSLHLRRLALPRTRILYYKIIYKQICIHSFQVKLVVISLADLHQLLKHINPTTRIVHVIQAFPLSSCPTQVQKHPLTIHCHKLLTLSIKVKASYFNSITSPTNTCLLDAPRDVNGPETDVEIGQLLNIGKQGMELLLQVSGCAENSQVRC
jgi:hypothetical protein